MVSSGLISKKVIAIVSVSVAIIVAIATIVSVQASVDYWLDRPESLRFERGLNHLTAYCKNGGGMDGDFSLVVTFVNVTFSNQTALPYLQVDNSTAKFRFLLHKGESNQKMVYFVADNATTEFSLTLTLEKTDPIFGFLFLKPNDMYPTQLSYQWNESSKSFDYMNSP
jgi:hypothetical protein